MSRNLTPMRDEKRVAQTLACSDAHFDSATTGDYDTTQTGKEENV